MTTSFAVYLLVLGAIGALTMALLQTFKDLTPVREYYNRRKLKRWLTQRAELILDKKGDNDVSGIVKNAADELVRLATDRDEYAFYGAELETLCTQFSGAALLVLDYPQSSAGLFELLTINASRDDVRLLQTESAVSPVPTMALQNCPSEELIEAAEKRRQIVDTRNRIRHQVTQSISSFQLSAGSRWQLWLKIWSWVISTLLTLAAFVLSGKIGPEEIGLILLTSVISGFLAPIARDLLAAIQGLR